MIQPNHSLVALTSNSCLHYCQMLNRQKKIGRATLRLLLKAFLLTLRSHILFLQKTMLHLKFVMSSNAYLYEHNFAYITI